MGLLGLGFTVVTLPGVVVNQVVQGLFEERYGASTEKFAVPDDLDEAELAENPERLSEVRALALFGANIAADLGGVASRQGDALLWLLALYLAVAVPLGAL